MNNLFEKYLIEVSNLRSKEGGSLLQVIRVFDNNSDEYIESYKVVDLETMEVTNTTSELVRSIAWELIDHDELSDIVAL